MPSDNIRMQGVFNVECVDENGNTVWEQVAHNLTTLQGRSNALKSIFNGQATPTFYIVPIEDVDSPGTAITTATTYSDIGSTGFTEWQEYAQGTRYVWTPSAESSQSVTNVSGTIDIQKNVSGSKNIWGFAIVTDGTKGDSAAAGAWLLSAAQFDEGPQVIQLNYTLKITYTMNMA